MSSSDGEGETGQYDDDSDDQKQSRRGQANDDDYGREEKAESSEEEAPSRKKSKKKKKKSIQEDDDEEEDRGKKNASDEGGDEEASSPRKRKKKGKKSKEKQEPGRKYIDEEVEESDGEGGVRKVDDDEDEDDESDDDDLRMKRKRKGAFIVSDDEEEDAPKKEKVVFTEREKRLDREDYDLIKENIGVDMRPMDESDSDEEEDDADKPKRKRLKRNRHRDADDDEDVGMKVSKKQGSRALEKALFEGADGDDDNDRVDHRMQHKRNTMYDDDSDSSMDSFIERDLEDDDRAGYDGEGRGPKRRGRRKFPQGPMGAEMDHAHEAFGEFFNFDDDDLNEDEDEDDRRKDKGAKAETNKVEELYEPALIEQFYMSKEDERIRRTDLPERLQIELADRVPLRNKDDAMEEAEWIFENEDNLKSSSDARNRWYRSDREDQELVEYIDPDIIPDENDPDKNRKRVTRSERANIVRQRLTQKICNVLCYLRGVENEDIKHGPIQLQNDHGEGEDDWDREKTRIPMYDVPFIAKYRREYWEPELGYDDLWRVMDADLRWSNLQKKKEALIESFKAARDDVSRSTRNGTVFLCTCARIIYHIFLKS
jgi:transcription elongation factor SPT6